MEKMGDKLFRLKMQELHNYIKNKKTKLTKVSYSENQYYFNFEKEKINDIK